jgi:putative transposase
MPMARGIPWSPIIRSPARRAAARRTDRKAYRELFRAKLPAQFVDDLRAATNGGWALGDERFKRQIAKMAGRRAAPLPKGRPPSKPADKRQPNLL